MNEKEKEEKKNKILDLIKRDKLDELKSFIQEKKVKSLDVCDKYKSEILMEAIEENASFSIIKFIIDQWFKNINHYYKYYSDDNDSLKYPSFSEFHRRVIESPLSLAVKTNNFKVANYLLAHDAKFDDLSINTMGDMITPKNSKYLLDSNIPVTPALICKAINLAKFYFVKDVFDYYVFGNAFILDLLLMYKNQTSISESQFNKRIEEEKRKVVVTDEMYKEAFDIYFCFDDYLVEKDEAKDYETIRFLYENDRREEEDKLFNIYVVLREYFAEEKFRLIKYIQQNEDSVVFDPGFYKILCISYEAQSHLEAMIDIMCKNDIPKLEEYINHHNIKLVDLHKEYRCEGVYYYDLLNRALWDANGPMIKFLIDQGADINMSDVPDVSPLQYQLHLAFVLKEQKLDLIKDLIAWGANVNVEFQGDTPLIMAVKIKSLELVQCMVENGADPNQRTKRGNTAIGAAILFQCKDILKYLVDHHGDVSKAVYQQTLPLDLAIDNKDVDMVQYLIELGIDIHSQNNPYKQWVRGPLANAASKNEFDIVKILIKEGATVNTEALIGAVEGGNLDIVKYIIAEGADLNQKTLYYINEYVTPLHVSIRENNTQLTEYLLQSDGIQVNMDDTDTNSHLNTAIMSGNDAIVKDLIEWAKRQPNDQHYKFSGKAYALNEKYNTKNDEKLPVKKILDHYVKYFKFKY